MSSFDDIESRIDALGTSSAPTQATAQLLSLGEEVLEKWVARHGDVPTQEKREGFRLLALHRQGAKGDPSFNACRETCRELAYHYNLIMLEPDHPEIAQRLLLASLVTKHLLLFVSGKMQVQQLGEFCCSSRPLHAGQ